MKRTRHSPEQIIAKLREADALLGGGASIGQVCQKLGVGLDRCTAWGYSTSKASCDDCRRTIGFARSGSTVAYPRQQHPGSQSRPHVRR